MINLKSVSIGYKKYVVLSDLNAEISAGEMLCLIGQNGCGKSTLLRTMAGLQAPLAGVCRINGQDVNALNVNDRAKLISLALTDKIEVENFTVFDLVSAGRYPHTDWLGNLTDNDKQIIRHAIELTGISHKQNSFLSELSDGEKQRAIIAKALAQSTPIIILDEPTAHLDLPNRIKTMSLLKKLSREQGKTILLSTHELDLAMQHADKIWLMTGDSTLRQAQCIANSATMLCGLPTDKEFERAIKEHFEL